MPLTRKIRTPHQRTYVTLTRALQALCTLLKCFPHTVHLATCITLSILLYFKEIKQLLCMCYCSWHHSRVASNSFVHSSKVFNTWSIWPLVHFQWQYISERSAKFVFMCFCFLHHSPLASNNSLHSSKVFHTWSTYMSSFVI